MTLCIRITLLAAAALATACASAPQPAPQAVAPAASCAQIEARLAQAQQARSSAQQDKDGAWKLVLPFAVVARRAQAGSAMEATDRQLAELRATQAQQGCSHGL